METQSNPSQNCAPRVTLTMPWRISKLVVLPNFRLEVTFLDGLSGQVDLSHKIGSKRAGVFEKLRDPLLFNQAFLEYGAVTWPGELDIAPDAMYEEIKKHGQWVLT